ncbi:alkyl sulfatase [Halioglobus sp. HI00S01]|uniref:alkyl/aryl-sulfatase n=1 Tax=Halioglobus sp. HI00S01 TaxID=1822214 RepID=UPI0007C31194|nr:alkyl sulfatase dimerization domain-containing protein [Halioglobus sp. HI00S01]KZX59039.1 alkyl sulfatase [Halioglobus sp. HI00S01]
MNKISLTTVAAAILLSGCSGSDTAQKTSAESDAGFTAPSAYTADTNRDIAAELPDDRGADLAAAQRGFIATRSDPLITTAAGDVVWDLDEYAFMEGPAPDSVNPSLWRQATLNNIHGLFKVTERIYQIRGFDLANMTLIKGDQGFIVVDPLTSEDTAAAGLEFARQHLGDLPVTAVLFTHSHIDHFAGVWGVIDEDDYQAGRIPVVAPEGFMEEATSENIIAGVAMSRRASFMYGRRLPREARGHVGSGLGKSPAYGTVGIAEPTEIIDHTGQTLTLDGLEFVFQAAPGSEAPAEFTFAIPELKAYCGAEVATRNLHNLYTLRGAKVRDALAWTGYIDEMIELSEGSDVYFASHHWPVWDRPTIVAYLETQRDTYKYIHDQTVRMFNGGMTPREIAEELALPEGLTAAYANRDYYGTVAHNSKAVYQAYLGWYDANPANLNPLPPVESSARYVALAGGAEGVIAEAEKSIEAGDYRWAAELLNHLVFAEPDNQQAMQLLASTYDQLAYVAESGPWRDVYLSAAYELRFGAPQESQIKLSLLVNMLEQTPVEKFFQTMSVRLDPDKAAGVDRRVGIVFEDLDEAYLLTVRNSVMHHRGLDAADEPDVVLKVSHGMFIRMLMGEVGLMETLRSDELSVEGNALTLASFFGMFEQPQGEFNIVTP